MNFAPPPQRAILLPPLLIWLIGVLVAVHIIRLQLDPHTDLILIYRFGVTPVEFGLGPVLRPVSGLPGFNLWTSAASLVTHMFLHADFTHLAFNSVWLAAFGTPVVRRLGAKGFGLIYLLGGLGGAALYISLNPSSFAPMIGASGAISALMGAVVRFALRPQRAPGALESSPVQSLTSRNVLIFTGIWFITNWLFGASGIGSGITGGQTIAWESHLGGFIVGILLFPAIDRFRKPR